MDVAFLERDDREVTIEEYFSWTQEQIAGVGPELVCPGCGGPKLAAVREGSRSAHFRFTHVLVAGRYCRLRTKGGGTHQFPAPIRNASRRLQLLIEDDVPIPLDGHSLPRPHGYSASVRDNPIQTGSSEGESQEDRTVIWGTAGIRLLLRTMAHTQNNFHKGWRPEQVRISMDGNTMRAQELLTSFTNVTPGDQYRLFYGRVLSISSDREHGSDQPVFLDLTKTNKKTPNRARYIPIRRFFSRNASRESPAFGLDNLRDATVHRALFMVYGQCVTDKKGNLFIRPYAYDPR